MKQHGYILWLLGSAVAFGAGEYLSKVFSVYPSKRLLVSLTLCYLVGVWLWLPALRARQSLIVAGTIWSVLSLLITFVMGALIFHEPVTVRTGLGVMFAATAIVFLT